MSTPTIAVLISGRGSDLQSIIDAIARGEIKGKIGVVISDKPDAYGLVRAKEAGIKAVCINRKEYTEALTFEQTIVKELQACGVELVVLAGFMRILSPYFIQQYKQKILNIHPSLLPAFPGAHAHRDVLAYGVKISGCTVHFVDEGMDSGPIIAQVVVPVLDDDTEDSLAARVLAEEHKLYPQIIAKYLEGKIKVLGRKVIIS